MKTSLVVAAVLSLLAGTAQAQSSVTVYGTLDVALQHSNSGGPVNTSVTKLTDSSGTIGNLGFRGSEDLGSGYAAIFNLEMYLAPQTGVAGKLDTSGALTSASASAVTSLFSRHAYVGLKGPFGTLYLGRTYTPTILNALAANAIVTGPDTGLVTATAAQGLANDYWNNNQIRYDSPSFAGVSGQVNYAPGGVSGSSRQGSNMGAGVAYKNEGMGLSLSHQRDNDILPTSNTVDWTFFTANYQLDRLKLTFGADRVHSSLGPAYPAWVNSRLWTVGSNYAVTEQFAVAGQYFSVRDDNSGSKSTQLVLNADYKLSKRTSVYVLLSRVSNGAVTIGPIYGTAGTRNADGSGVSSGVQHRF